MTSVWVAGVGVFAPGLAGWTAAGPALRGEKPWELSDLTLPSPTILPKNERRRASPTIRLALEAAQQAISSSGFAADDLLAVFGSSSGDGDVLDTILNVVTGSEPRVSPTLFHNSVHNAAGGYASIATGSRAPSLSLGAYDGTVPATLLTASIHARRRPTLLCVYDAVLPETLRQVRRISLPFAAALVLSPTPPPSPIAQATISFGDEADGAHHIGSLGALQEANPSARILPLLEAIAQRRTGSVYLPWEGSPPLEVSLVAC